MSIAQAYESTTRDVRVRVAPEYMAERSSPEDARYFWTYAIEIANLGPVAVQLISRHWRITDASGRVEHVRGPGVVGETPVIGPGEIFSYTSGCPLRTPSGIMTGTYEMEVIGGERFDAAIPTFSLDSDNGKRALN